MKRGWFAESRLAFFFVLMPGVFGRPAQGALQTEPSVESPPQTNQDVKQPAKDDAVKPRVWLTTSEKDGQRFVTAHWEGLREPAILVLTKTNPKKSEDPRTRLARAIDDGVELVAVDASVSVLVIRDSGEASVRILPGPFVDRYGTAFSEFRTLVTKELIVSVKVNRKGEEGRPKWTRPLTVEQVTLTTRDLIPDWLTIKGRNGPGAAQFFDIKETREFEVSEGGYIEITSFRDDTITESNVLDLAKR